MSEPSERPFDLGLQLERTALAWQRTALSFVIATLVGARLLTSAFNTSSFIIGALGVFLMVLIFIIGHRRYRMNHLRLTAARSAHVPFASASPLIVYTVLTLSLGLFGLFFVLF